MIRCIYTAAIAGSMLSDICGERRAKHETKSDFLR